MKLSPSGLTCEKICTAYKELLKANPGSALCMPEGGAVFLVNDQIFAASLNALGALDDETIGSLNEESWDDERCCWESQDGSAICVEAVNRPKFIELVFQIP